MPSVTLKNVPEALLGRLRERAESDRRSLNQEVLFLLERALEEPDDRYPSLAEAAAQADAWTRISGHWDSDLSAEEEIREIYEARTLGRPVEL